MKQLTKELNVLTTLPNIKAEAFNAMCAAILSNYNKLTGFDISMPAAYDYFGEDKKNHIPLNFYKR